MKKFITIVAYIVLVPAVLSAIGWFVDNQYSKIQDKVNATESQKPTYMGMTRQDYLDKVSHNGQDTAALCGYTHLIDTYGLEETFKMDYRVSKDETDIDQRIYDAVDMCVGQ